MYAGYVESDIDWYVKSIDEYVGSVDIDCYCWDDAAGLIDWSGKGLYAIDCWNWGDIFEFDENARFVADASVADANAGSDDCCW